MAYLGDLVLEELHLDPAGWLAANGDVEEDLGVGHVDSGGVCECSEVCGGGVLLCREMRGSF